jgi:hypothetical protein
VSKSNDLVSRGLFDSITPAAKESLLSFNPSTELGVQLDRAMGTMTALAVGEGLGHMLDGLPVRDFNKANAYTNEPLFTHSSLGNSANAKQGGEFVKATNVYGIQIGQWLGGTSFSLCMADAILTNEGRFPGRAMRKWFWTSWKRGINSAFRNDPKTGAQKHSKIIEGDDVHLSLPDVEKTKDGSLTPM